VIPPHRPAGRGARTLVRAVHARVAPVHVPWELVERDDDRERAIGIVKAGVVTADQHVFVQRSKRAHSAPSNTGSFSHQHSRGKP